MGRTTHRLAPLRFAAGGLALFAAAAVHADDQPVDDLLADFKAHASLALGASLSLASSSTSTSRPALQPHPLWAFQYGRIRFSSGGAAAVLGIVQDPRGPGASAELLSSDQLRLGVALRIDRGRDSSAVDGLDGLPDVPATLRLRGYASYALTKRWTAAASVSQDILGRGGGTVATGDIGYNAPLTPASEWYAGAGLAWSDWRNMNSYYGVSAEAAATSHYPAYAPGAGLTNLHVGVGFTAALTSRWILFGSAGATRLVGYAADSPLTTRPLSASAAIGLAYRWGAKYNDLGTVLLPVPAKPAPAP